MTANIAPHQQPQAQFPLVAKVINGGVAGIVGVASLFPIDLAKTRLQNQTPGNEMYKSMLDCLRKVIKAEGYFGLYRGSAVNLLLITPEKSIKLVGNDLFRHLLSTNHKSHPDTGKTHLTLPREMLAGGGAGLCQIVITVPMELLKIQGQDAGRTAAKRATTGPTVPGVITSQKQPSTMKIALDIVKTKGFGGLYRGASSTILRDVSFSIVYFPLFAHLSSLAHSLTLNKERDKEKPHDTNSKFWVNFLSGCTAAGISAVVVNPADVVKTRCQLISLGSSEVHYKSVRDAFAQIYRHEGPRAFLKGAGCRVMYIAPLFGIAQTVYYLGIGEKILQKLE